MPEPYVISTSTSVEEIISTLHAASSTRSVSQVGEQALLDALNRGGVSISKLDLCYWVAELPQPEAVFPFIQVHQPGASSLAAIFSAARTIIAGDANIIAAGGAGQFTAASQYKKLVSLFTSFEVGEIRSTVVHPVKGSGCLLLASTEAVGVHNLLPCAQISARIQMPLDQANPARSIRQIVQKALGNAQVDLNSIGEVIVDPWPLQQTWSKALDAEDYPDLVIKSLVDHAGELQGLRLVSQLIADLHSQDIAFGMVVQSAWDGTLLSGIFTKI